MTFRIMPSMPYFAPSGRYASNGFRNDYLDGISHSGHPTMYTLAGDVIPVQHQEQSQFAGLVQAAQAVASHEEPASGTTLPTDENLRASGAQSKSNGKRRRSPMQADVPRRPSDPRTSGANSGSALFRNSSATKKRTRPPMSKLFSSLELSSENFLQLQSAAKQYMLDDVFPDRRETVGIRGKGDSELVKLRLLGCVKDFLEGEGNGARFFGSDVSGEDGNRRTMIWPRDKQKIVAAVTPLLRRIITNERQRQYALETRSKEQPSADRSPHAVRTPTVSEPEYLDDSREQLLPLRASGLFFEEFGDPCNNQYYEWKELAYGEPLSKLVNIWNRIGLKKDDFNDLIKTLHWHFRSTHMSSERGVISCSAPCERAVIEKLVVSGLWQDGHWGCDPLSNYCDRTSLSVDSQPQLPFLT